MDENKNTELFEIEGMTCGHCVRSVREAIEEIEGATVEDVAIGKALVSYDPAHTDRGTIAHAIEEAGYTVAP